MTMKERMEQYRFQQSEAGQEQLQMLEFMRSQYCKKLNIFPSKIKIGKLSPLVNGNTGIIDRFIEE